MTDRDHDSDAEFAECIRRAFIAAATEAYETASLSGLCAEGAWECALDAIRSLDLSSVAAAPRAPADPVREQ